MLGAITSAGRCSQQPAAPGQHDDRRPGRPEPARSREYVKDDETASHTAVTALSRPETRRREPQRRHEARPSAAPTQARHDKRRSAVTVELFGQQGPSVRHATVPEQRGPVRREPGPQRRPRPRPRIRAIREATDRGRRFATQHDRVRRLRAEKHRLHLLIDELPKVRPARVGHQHGPSSSQRVRRHRRRIKALTSPSTNAPSGRSPAASRYPWGSAEPPEENVLRRPLTVGAEFSAGKPLTSRPPPHSPRTRTSMRSTRAFTKLPDRVDGQARLTRCHAIGEQPRRTPKEDHHHIPSPADRRRPPAATAMMVPAASVSAPASSADIDAKANRRGNGHQRRNRW